MKRALRAAIRRFGYDIVPWQSPADSMSLPADLTSKDVEIMRRIRGYTMTSIERQAALISAVRHLIESKVEGCMVECGVWRGGSSMATALTLLQEGVRDRDLYLFDTFEGMTPPSAIDETPDGTSAQSHLATDSGKSGFTWAVADIQDVQRTMATTHYPTDKIHYVKGPVETTIPAHAPPTEIALLRLDTDWYESTRHELIHLFPRLAQGGILIVDDYGFWAGARKAVDEFLAGLPQKFYLHRIDDTGRLLIKR